MIADNSRRGTGLPNPDYKSQMMADSTGNLAGDDKREGLTNPMELCSRNGGPDQ